MEPIEERFQKRSEINKSDRNRLHVHSLDTLFYASPRVHSWGLSASAERQSELKTDSLYRTLGKAEVRPGVSGLQAVAERLVLEENANIGNEYLRSWTENALKFLSPLDHGAELRVALKLFSIKENIEHIADNLNDENISKQLRDRYKKEGYPLLENVSVSVEENGEEWEICDRIDYKIREKDERLNIYENEVWKEKYPSESKEGENFIAQGSVAITGTGGKVWSADVRVRVFEVLD